MARIGNIATAPGVTAETDMRGNIKTFTVNVKKCSDDILSFFTSLGFHIENPKYDPKFVKKIKEREKGHFSPINPNDIWNSL